MSEENLLHAVSHKLYLERSGENLYVIITDKYNRILDSSAFSVKTANDLDGLFQSQESLQSIYSQVVLVSSASRFVSMPQSITEEKDKKEIYSLSYTPSPENILLEDHIGIQLMVYYEQNRAFINQLRIHYPKLLLFHELRLLHDAVLPKLSDEVNSITAHISNESLLIMAFTQGKLIFSNYFILNGEDDVFYFVMLTIEQLEFDPGYTELILLDEGKGEAGLKEKFDRFVKRISTPSHLFDEHSENNEWSGSIGFAGQAAIQCA